MHAAAVVLEDRLGHERDGLKDSTTELQDDQVPTSQLVGAVKNSYASSPGHLQTARNLQRPSE